MEYDSKGPILKVLLILNDQPRFGGIQSPFLPFPESLLAFEHTLQTLHSAVPSADTIYISLQDKRQISDIQFRLDNPSPLFSSHAHSDHDHHSRQISKLKIILDEAGSRGSDIGSVANLLAAHMIYPDSSWLVVGCGFPLLPPPALQQLVLKYQDPVTCFVREDGNVEPSLRIWGSEALERLKISVESGGFVEQNWERVVENMQRKLVKPLREEWNSKPQTIEEWEVAMMTWKEIRGGG
ncbi:hypothetical protein IFR05_008686 [Cadophora sp. M221]|nr:hypothetical protein IFR05_008686 [Cadophora sp. M221]